MTSFEFSWDNSNKVTAKAFARKKSVNKTNSVFENDNNDNNNKINDKKLIKLDNSKPKKFFRTPTEYPDSPQKFVKRKQKKDKLAVKQATQNDNSNSSVISHNNKQTQNHSLFSVPHKSIYVNTDVRGLSVVENVFTAGHKFSDLNIHKHLVSNLEKNSFTTLTTVQEKSIPTIIEGKDVLIRSQTGSGKTLAYAVPVINTLQGINPRIQRQDGVQAIIIVPTRELALQTHELFNKINTFQWIVVGHLCGGENRKTEKDRLRKGVHVLIGTPGRLLDHILHTTALKISNVQCLVLDEADRLLDMGFKKDIVKIVEEIDKAKVNAEYDPMALLKGQVPNEEENEKDSDVPPLKNPKSKHIQTLLLSATLSKDIAELADFTMKEHVYIDALSDFPNINPNHIVIPNTVKQEFIMTYIKHRLFTLSAILIAKCQQNAKVFVFMATGQMVDYHYELFTRCLVKMPVNRKLLKSVNALLLDEIDLDSENDDEEEEIVLDTQFFKLHGSMDQAIRKKVFSEFRAAKKGVLLCTDVAARGIDVPEADCIIQYTGPQSDDVYIHRVGRTGRAGKAGSSLIFLTHEEQEYIQKLQQHKVFLKKADPNDYLKHICDLMEEPDQELAATALQRRYENTVMKDKDLYKMACFAYSSWSRFYNTYPGEMRKIFNFKNINLGHYVTSFGIRDTPSNVAKVVRGQVATIQPKKLNMKLATHSDDQPLLVPQKRKMKSSGLESKKKKKKKI